MNAPANPFFQLKKKKKKERKEKNNRTKKKKKKKRKKTHNIILVGELQFFKWKITTVGCLYIG
jgi:hypothetical protein